MSLVSVTSVYSCCDYWWTTEPSHDMMFKQSPPFSKDYPECGGLFVQMNEDSQEAREISIEQCYDSKTQLQTKP